MDERRNIIAALSEDNFNSLVTAYIKGKYNADEVWVCNGPYDGGKDIVAAKGDKEIRINFQATVQKNRIENKIKDDVNKLERALKTGVAKSNKLSFFCSLHISQSKVDEYTWDALANHDVELDIFENYRLASLTTNYPGMNDVVISVVQKMAGSGNLKLDKNQRLLLDYLATSYDASEMKASFIRVFILFRLYHEGPATAQEIFDSLTTTFGSKLDKTFVDGLIGRLKSKGFIRSEDRYGKKVFRIDDEHADKIRNIENKSRMDEAVLIGKINGILQKYKISDPDYAVTKKIVGFLGGNYDVDPSELGKPRNNGISSERRKIDNLKSVIIQHSTDDNVKALEVVNEIIEVANKWPIVEKCAASKLLMNLYKTNTIENFLSRSVRTIVYDTPVLLQRICLFMDEMLDFEDYLFRTVKLMTQVIDDVDFQILQYTTTSYLEEVVYHLCEAYKLRRFLGLPWIAGLGKSKNVFFNYYLHREKNGDYNNFEDFLKELLNTVPTDEGRLKRVATRRLKDVLEACGIEIRPFQSYTNFESTRAEYEKILFSSGSIIKSEKPIRNDVNAILEIEELAHKLESEQGLPLNFITWDNSFFTYKQALNDSSYWNVVDPQRFANNLSIAKFQVNPDAIGNPMLLYLSDNILSQDAGGFLDIINDLYKSDQIKGIKLLNTIADLRKRQLEQVSDSDVINDKLPIDEFLNLLLSHFKSAESNAPEIIALSDALQDDSIAEEIAYIIKSNLGGFKSGDGRLKPSIAAQFQTIIRPYLPKEEG